MKNEKLIRLKELEKLSSIKAENFELRGDKTYLLVTKKDSNMPHEIYSDVLTGISKILNQKGIESIIVDKSAFESLDIYEMKGVKDE